MAFELSYDVVVNVLAEMHNVREDRRSALASRVKDFQRRGFPAGLNTGKGRPARYGPDAFLNLSIAFEMLQFGIGPERIIATLRKEAETVQDAWDDASDATASFDPRADRKDVFMWFDPLALEDLTTDEAVERYRGVRAVSYGNGKQLGAALTQQRRGPVHRRLAIINLSDVVLSGLMAVANQGISGAAEFIHDFARWPPLPSRGAPDGNT